MTPASDARSGAREDAGDRGGDRGADPRRARELWEREGRPEGWALRHWLDAERRVREELAHAAAMRDAAEHTVGPCPSAAGARPALTPASTPYALIFHNGLTHATLARA